MITAELVAGIANWVWFPEEFSVSGRSVAASYPLGENDWQSVAREVGTHLGQATITLAVGGISIATGRVGVLSLTDDEALWISGRRI